MAKNFYAVKVGKVPGLYTTWEECRENISGFSGAVYKGFDTKEEALLFINGINNSSYLKSDKKEPESAKTQITAYVDGSYDSETNAFSYGMVLFDDGQELHFSEKFIDDDLAQMHNVAGELKGAEAAIKYCLDNDFKSVTIYHDYEGIARWCTGDWKAKKAGTIAYSEFCHNAAKKLDIHFVKVKGHSGDTYNELADKLAKSALGING